MSIDAGQRIKHGVALQRIEDKRKLDAQFVLLVAWLPLKHPVKWRFFRGPHYGQATFDPKEGHLLQIKRGPMREMRDTLIHEYAHALADEACPELDEHHSDLWGVNYARCYRVLELHWDGPDW